MLRLHGNVRDRRARRLLDPAETRPIRVLIDTDSLSTGDDVVASRYTKVLESLFRQDQIHILRFEGEEDEPENYQPWTWQCDRPLSVFRSRSNPNVSHLIQYVDPTNGKQISTAISGELARGDIDIHDQTYAHLSDEAAAELRRKDTVVLGTAISIHADLLVTDRPYLLRRRWIGTRDLTVCPSTAAAQLLGLFLRSRGNYTIIAAPNYGRLTYNHSKAEFMGLAISHLAPSLTDWILEVVVGSWDTPIGDLRRLGESVPERLERTLIARDMILRRLSLAPSKDVADDLLLYLDALLLFLSGAFDAVARIAHFSAGTTASIFNVSWRNKGWRRELCKREPRFTPLVQAGTRGADLLEVLACLRNTVHAAGIDTREHSKQGDFSPIGKELKVLVPEYDVSRLRQALDRQGWSAAWGMSTEADGRVTLMPDLLATQLLTESILLVEQLVAATPVANLRTTELHRATSPDGARDDDLGYSAAVQLGLRMP